MRIGAIFVISLSLAGCISAFQDVSWCSIKNEAIYEQFSPDQELISDIHEVSDAPLAYRIDRNKKLVWKKANDKDILVCTPGVGMGAPSCGSVADRFVEGESGWTYEESELTNCH